MRTAIVVVAGLLLCFALAFQAGAQPKGPPTPKAPPEPPVQYFNLSPDIFPEHGTEAYLKEMRQGSKLVSAEIEVCHAPAPGSNRRDRFVVPLRVEGDRLVGSGQSQENKNAVSVNLVRSGTSGNLNYEGTIRVGSLTTDVHSTDNMSISPEDFADVTRFEDVIELTPDDFIEFSPQALNVLVSRTEMPRLLGTLRAQNVIITFNSVETSCRVLRSGQYIVRLIVDPDRTAAVLAAVRAIPGVQAGYGSGSLRMDRAVQFTSAGWRSSSGGLERAKLAGMLGDAMAKSLGGTVEKSSWDDRTGQLAVVVKRPYDVITGMKLQEVMTITLVIAPEKPGNRERSILWIETVSWRIADDGSAPGLAIQSPDIDQAGDYEPDGVGGLTKALAAALKGQTWDGENNTWR